MTSGSNRLLGPETRTCVQLESHSYSLPKESHSYSLILMSIIYNHTFYSTATHVSCMLLLKPKPLIMCIIFNNAQNVLVKFKDFCNNQQQEHWKAIDASIPVFFNNWNNTGFVNLNSKSPCDMKQLYKIKKMTYRIHHH